MNADPLAAILERGGPLVVLSPHLDDAALSCGAMMIHACQTIPVTVATLFTEAGPPPYTLSARRYLHQVGAKDAPALYRQRREEDRAALQPLGITCVHAGLVDAPFRRQPGSRARSWWARLMPELAHIYPVYRLNITSGRIAPADSGTLQAAASLVQRLAAAGPALVLAPLGVGRHVDHVLVRTAAERSGADIAYYSDFPHNQHHAADRAFIKRNGLVEARWPRSLEAKAELVRAYRTQTGALFPGGRIPLVPEVFYFPPETPSGAALGGASG
jgi:LmbE family N-acetylglucosaminyl deacetylase